MKYLQWTEGRGNNTWKSNVADHLKDVLHSANHTPKIMFHNTPSESSHDLTHNYDSHLTHYVSM